MSALQCGLLSLHIKNLKTNRKVFQFLPKSENGLRCRQRRHLGTKTVRRINREDQISTCHPPSGLPKCHQRPRRHPRQFKRGDLSLLKLHLAERLPLAASKQFQNIYVVWHKTLHIVFKRRLQMAPNVHR